jgi:hypothetical protein
MNKYAVALVVLAAALAAVYFSGFLGNEGKARAIADATPEAKWLQRVTSAAAKVYACADEFEAYMRDHDIADAYAVGAALRDCRGISLSTRVERRSGDTYAVVYSLRKGARCALAQDEDVLRIVANVNTAEASAYWLRNEPFGDRRSQIDGIERLGCAALASQFREIIRV